MSNPIEPRKCGECGRTDGRHGSWGSRGDVIDEVRCKGIYSALHCPNTAPIGGGGYCGPCRWSRDGRSTISSAELAMETLGGTLYDVEIKRKA